MPPRSRPLRRALAALLVAASVVLGLVPVAPVEVDVAGAQAAGASVVVNGRGWGHGRGMGQYGARGYASGHATGTPWSHEQILDHFYGGTTMGLTAAGSTVRVWLKARDGDNTWFSTKAGGFSVGGQAVPAGNAARIVRDGAGWRVDTAAACGAPVNGSFATADPSALPLAPASSTDNLIRICDGTANGKPYRGFMTSVVGDGILRTVNTVALEDYLRGVVPDEMPASWEPAAVRAQAVAARSYALAQGGPDGNRWAWAKTCDDIFCQVYNGVNAEQAASDAAIAATARQVRVGSDGKVKSTEFSSSTGGYTAGGTFGAVPDLGDSHPSNPNRSWSATLDPAAIAAKYGLGTLQGIAVTKRNGHGADGGRALELRLDGSTKSLPALNANTFRSDMGLKSDWFTIERGGISLQRISGADRFATAAAIAKGAFPTADVAIVVRGDGPSAFADALAANFLGGVLSAPTLLTNAGNLPSVTAEALQSMGVTRVKVLGGPDSVSDGVLAQLDERYDVERIAGDNRYGTAAAVARAGAGSIGTTGGKKTAVLSSGTSFPDALAAGGLVHGMRFPQLLTEAAALSAETAAVLTELGIQHVIITGGIASVSEAVRAAVDGAGITTERPHGSDRFQTAMVLADLAIDRYGYSRTHVDIPTGEAFPDALTAGAHAGKAKAAIVLGNKLGVTESTCSFLRRRAGTLTGGHVFGGPSTIDDSAKAALEGCTRS